MEIFFAYRVLVGLIEIVVIVNVVSWIGRKREGFDERSREGRMMARGLLFLTVVRNLRIFTNNRR